MPLYAYKCTKCNHEFDDFNSMAKCERTKCEKCGATAKQVLTPIRLDYYNMGVQSGLPTAIDKWEKMHKKEARRKYE